MTFKHFLQASTAAALACAAALLPTAGQAQAPTDFPSRPVRFIVPYSPGGLPDTVARIISQRLQEGLGQSVVVENKPGGSGAAAAAVLTQAPADGYTLLLTDGPMLAITPLVVKKMSYDAHKDFMPVSLIGTAPLFLAVHAGVKANTLDELIAQAKAEPGKLNYGSSGLGSIHHLFAQMGNGRTQVQDYQGCGAGVCQGFHKSGLFFCILLHAEKTGEDHLTLLGQKVLHVGNFRGIDDRHPLDPVAQALFPCNQAS